MPKTPDNDYIQAFMAERKAEYEETAKQMGIAQN